MPPARPMRPITGTPGSVPDTQIAPETEVIGKSAPTLPQTPKGSRGDFDRMHLSQRVESHHVIT